MTKAKKKLIISIAKEAEAKGKVEGLSSEETVKWFVDQMKANRIPTDGWFSIDDEIRKEHEIANWFWIIRTIRNNMHVYGWKIESPVKKPKLHVTKQSENHWLVWGTLRGEIHSADVVSFVEQGFLGGKTRFRVDVAGKTVASLIDHFQTAKSIAMKHVKEAFDKGGIVHG